MYAPLQVLIRWSQQKGFITLVKSNNPERQRANLEVFGWELAPEAMARLDGLDEGFITGWNPIRDDPV